MTTQDPAAQETPGEAPSLRVADFERLFGTPAGSLPPECRARVHQNNFAYRALSKVGQELQLVHVLERIDTGNLTTAGPEGKGRWEDGWGESLIKFRSTGSFEALVPAYIRPGQPVRLDGQYVDPHNPEFERHWFEVFQEWLFRTTPFRDAEIIYEFGCGSGINLAKLASIYPDKRYVGLDWAAPSAQLVTELGRQRGWRMEGKVFDFFLPDQGAQIEDGAVVFTLGALEQTGDAWHAFLDYLLQFRPAACVHIEPIVEWYGDWTLFDYAAKRFHRARRYWTGFPDKLKALAEEERIQILKQKRSDFGSLYLEGYSQLIWRPL